MPLFREQSSGLFTDEASQREILIKLYIKRYDEPRVAITLKVKWKTSRVYE